MDATETDATTAKLLARADGRVLELDGQRRFEWSPLRGLPLGVTPLVPTPRDRQRAFARGVRLAAAHHDPRKRAAEERVPGLGGVRNDLPATADPIGDDELFTA